MLNDSPIEKAEPHYHRHALELLCRAPAAASRSFASRYPGGLSERRMLPAFMNYERRRAQAQAADRTSRGGPPGSFVDDPAASIRYMEAVVRDGCRSRAVFNYLVSLYAGLGDEAPLFRFLSEHVPPASSAGGVGPPGDGSGATTVSTSSSAGRPRRAPARSTASSRSGPSSAPAGTSAPPSGSTWASG